MNTATNNCPACQLFDGCAMAVLPAGALSVGGSPCALVDRTFSRSGFVAFVAQGGGEVTRRRKGVGAAVNLVMPRYSNDEPCGYHGNLHASAHHGAVHTWATSRAGTMATCMQAPTTALPPFFPTGGPRRAHRDAADGAIHTPTTAPPIRPRRRHLHAHELGARESAGLLSRACDGLVPTSYMHGPEVHASVRQ